MEVTMVAVELVGCSVLGYLVGCINPAYIIGKIKGVDIRKTGNGNAGGTNVIFSIGRILGVITTMIDIAKAAGVAFLAENIFLSAAEALPSARICGMIAALFCMLGHIFPAPLKFKGGKGFACFAGLVLYSGGILPFIILAFISGVLCLLFRYGFISGIAMACIYPFIYFFTHSGGERTFGIVIMLLASGIIIARLAPNFKRIKDGKEIAAIKFFKKTK